MANAFEFGQGNGWPGIAKLMEEAGEVVQVCAKLVMTDGSSDHWDGSKLDARLADELGDLLAAINFVLAHCPQIDVARVMRQSESKLARFEAWHAKPMLP